jgi:hypothetical protein
LKRGENVFTGADAWQKRWFLLRNNQLHYFKTAQVHSLDHARTHAPTTSDTNAIYSPLNPSLAYFAYNL